MKGTEGTEDRRGTVGYAGWNQEIEFKGKG